MREHGFHGWFSNASARAFGKYQCGCERPLPGQRQCRNRKHIDRVTSKSEEPVLPSLIREIAGNRAQGITDELAETTDKSNDCRARP